MCGVIGRVTGGDGTMPDSTARARLLEGLSHRGPDARGETVNGGVWLGHLRLSILDLSDAGAQPMVSSDGRYVLTYNGEVYNFRELADELGLHLRSRSDTEVVLEAFARHGPEILPRLNGMFAFAVHDLEDGRVWLVRDRLGIKPLYYHVGPAGLSFASELGSLLAMVPEARACEVGHLHEWVYYGTSLGGRSLYRGIRSVLPGQVLEVDARTLERRTTSYWSPADHAGAPKLDLDPDARARRTLDLLEAAVARQLVSDVPLGVTLSGGIDSSAITALASRHHGGRLATYSVGFDYEHGRDELATAARTAHHFGTDHHELHISGYRTTDVVERMVDHHAHPFSDAANIPLYLIASEVAGATKVVLQGDGGDEMFGGYPRYRSLSRIGRTRLLARLGALATSPLGGRLHQRLERYRAALDAGTTARTMALLLTEETEASRPGDVFGPAVRERVLRADPFARYEECHELVADEDLVNRMLMIDAMVILPDIFLEKVDRATMAASIEVRVPFLDHDLVDFCLRLRGPDKVPGGRQKWLLRRALAGILPRHVLERPKSGFGVPYGQWLRTGVQPLFLDAVHAFASRHPGVLDRDRVLRYHAEHVDGTRDRSFLLWKVLNFTLWANRFEVTFS